MKTVTFAQGFKLTASLTGWSGPAVHAVPRDAPKTDAVSLCGVTELTVLEEWNGERPEWGDDLIGACKRCAKKLGQIQ